MPRAVYLRQDRVRPGFAEKKKAEDRAKQLLQKEKEENSINILHSDSEGGVQPSEDQWNGWRPAQSSPAWKSGVDHSEGKWNGDKAAWTDLIPLLVEWRLSLSWSLPRTRASLLPSLALPTPADYLFYRTS